MTWATSLRGRTRRFQTSPGASLGSSSGGYIALALAADPFRWGCAMDFSFTLALCPVADPLARANYLRAVINGTSEIEPRHEPERARQILENQLSYFPGGDDQMCRGAGLVNEYAMGQTFVVAGAQDKNVPLHVLSKVIPRATARSSSAGPVTRSRPCSKTRTTTNYAVAPRHPRGREGVGKAEE